jgi:protease I
MSTIGNTFPISSLYTPSEVPEALFFLDKPAVLRYIVSMKKILMISADNFEDLELKVPYYRLKEEGHEVTLASVRKGTITGKHGYTAEAEAAVGDVTPADFDALIIPGGKAPGILRKDEDVLDAARHFVDGGKPVAAICHGPQVLISAGLMEGRRATCYKSVKDEMKDAGADYADREVVVDGTLVTSRQPEDLPAFMREFMKQIR